MRIFGLYIGRHEQPKVEYRDLNDFSVSDYNLLIKCVSESRNNCNYENSLRFKARQDMIKKLNNKVKTLQEEIHLIITSKI